MTLKPMFILFILLCLAGCASHQPHVDLLNKHIDWSQETPDSVKARIVQSAQGIKILSAFFSLSMNPPPEKMMSSLSGVITIDSRNLKPKVRIQAFHLFGSTLFDMVNTDVTKIYVPRKNTMYISQKDDKKTDDKGPQTIFANMMLEPSSLILTKQKLEITKESIILRLQDGWLVLNPQNGLITSRHKDDIDINYAAYTTLANGSLLPTTINIATTDGSFKAKCTLSKISLPESLPEDFFKLNEYKPKDVVGMEKL